MHFWEGHSGKKEQSTEQSSSEEERIVKLPDLGSVAISATINCVGEKYPRPQLLAKKALRNLENGQVLEVIVDNSPSVETIPVMLPSEHGKHLTTIRNDSLWALYVMKMEESGHSDSTA